MHKRLLTTLVLALVLVGFVAGTAMAATISDFTSGNKSLSKAGIEPTQNWIPFVQYRKFDLNSSALSTSGVTNADVIRLFNVTKNTFITEIGFMNLRALHTGTSAVIGDGNSASGYITNDYSSYVSPKLGIGVPFLDLTTVGSGLSVWQYMGQINSGSGYFARSGISMYVAGGTGTAGATTWAQAHNYGTYFTRSGITCYADNDTIDMTIYVDKSVGLTSRVTPYFEAYIKGFKRVDQ
jgi:hypothetical protein